MDTKVYQITKMDGSNYFLWRIKVEMLLQKEKVWSVIESPVPDPITDDWRGKDQAARATIGLTLEDRILITTANCNTARKMWEFLKTTYEHKGLASRLYLLKKLYGVSYDTHGNMEAYLTEVLEIIERLRTIGEDVKEHHLVAIILCGLPASFNPLITALEMKEGDDMKLTYVLERLRDEAQRHEGRRGESYDHNVAITHTQPSLRRKIVCHLCSREGHIRRNCPQNYANNKVTEDRLTEGNNYRSYYSFEEQNPARDSESEWALNGITEEEINKENWLIDSGASSHMSHRKENFKNFEILNTPLNVKVANGDTVQALGEGNMEINVILPNEKIESLKLSKVLYIPNLTFQLISVPALCHEGYQVTFDYKHCSIIKEHKLYAEGQVRDKSYILSEKNIKSETYEKANPCIHLWHSRLGHRSISTIKKMSRSDFVKDLEISKCKHEDFCKYCHLGTMRQKHFETSENHAIVPFKIIVTDVCGPITPGSFGGSQYILTLTDEASNYSYIKLMQNKSETTEHVINFLNQGYNQFNYYPEILRSDEGGEYMGKTLNDYLNLKGIIHQTSVTYTPQQNGRSERLNLTLLNMARSMLKSSGLPKGLWGESINTANYIKNRIPLEGQTKTPYELWYNRIPSLKHIRMFGCPAFALIPGALRKKLDDRAVEGYLVGYGEKKKCYRLWMPGSNTIKNAISVIFHESPMNEESHNKIVVKPDVNVDIDWNSNQDDKITNQNPNCLRRSTRSNFGVPAEKWTYHMNTLKS